ncbi:hypothetical protein SAMN04488498_12646 [Mesorhizobium albiziae]|uniref:Uncharacterized protein n=1 Tax=Neomesorhizobium albiziae TaxID=335020 RepID=A0A1I4EL35_9HYPH|nr:hypothetical protein [Mesorhizobium albiziae]GLS32022.1 hypothetical protein GCM10007937_37320 [Mesorhizobium albiziae]SFL04881.1 hypothetical protein SAMN04488498_12646 [Mesorhizobium albiziae]
MIIDYSPGDGLRLVESEDFKGFKLQLRDAPEARSAIEDVVLVDDGNILIAEAVPSLPGAYATAEWQAAYRGMVDNVAAKGWIDTAANAIHAHAERIP